MRLEGEARELEPERRRSAWTPWVRPTHSVPACSRARSASAAASSRAPGTITSAGAASCSASAVSSTSEEVSPSGSSARPRGRAAEHVDEGGHVMVGDRLALLDRLDREGGRPDRLEVRVGGPFEGLRRCHLDVAPGGHPGLVGPDRAELRRV